MIYTALESSFIKFYPEYIECFIGVNKNSTKTQAFFRNQPTVVVCCPTVPSSIVVADSEPINRVEINGIIVAKELFRKEALALKAYLDLYLNHSDYKRPENTNTRPEEETIGSSIEFN